MGRGSYLGGCTVIGPRSGWFSGAGQSRTQKAAVVSRPGSTGCSRGSGGNGQSVRRCARQQLQEVRLRQDGIDDLRFARRSGCAGTQ